MFKNILNSESHLIWLTQLGRVSRTRHESLIFAFLFFIPFCRLLTHQIHSHSKVGLGKHPSTYPFQNREKAIKWGLKHLQNCPQLLVTLEIRLGLHEQCLVLRRDFQLTLRESCQMSFNESLQGRDGVGTPV